jgi:hypothetical protein
VGAVTDSIRQFLLSTSSITHCDPRKATGSRYGRFYFRPISGYHPTFGISNFSLGVLAFSRILNLIIANFSTTAAQAVSVVTDANLSASGDHLKCCAATSRHQLS